MATAATVASATKRRANSWKMLSHSLSLSFSTKTPTLIGTHMLIYLHRVPNEMQKRRNVQITRDTSLHQMIHYKARQLPIEPPRVVIESKAFRIYDKYTLLGWQPREERNPTTQCISHWMAKREACSMTVCIQKRRRFKFKRKAWIWGTKRGKKEVL